MVQIDNVSWNKSQYSNGEENHPSGGISGGRCSFWGLGVKSVCKQIDERRVSSSDLLTDVTLEPPPLGL